MTETEMERPKEIERCPFCDKKAVQLKMQNLKHITKSENKLTEGKYWVYECQDCGMGFTSTESDTISEKTWKHKHL